MADPINHDGASTVATVGSRAVIFGFLAGAAALAIPVALGAATLFVGIPAVAAAFTSGSSFLGGIGAAFLPATLTLLGGALTAASVVGSATLGLAGIGTVAGGAAVGGGLLGALSGADKVSRESNAFRRRVEANMAKGENKEAKLFNDGEIKGIDEGYAMAVQDLQPQMQAAFQKGQESVVQQIQAQMMQAAAAEQQAAPAQPKEGKFADKFECKAACHAEAEIVKREEKAAQPNQLG